MPDLVGFFGISQDPIVYMTVCIGKQKDFFQKGVYLLSPNHLVMQYTTNKPFDSVLIVQASGLRYRLQSDHLFKDIPYPQITKVKIIKDKSRILIAAYIPFIILSQWENIISGEWNWLTVTFLILILIETIWFFCSQSVYTLAIEKGPLTAEVFMTHQLAEVEAIKKDIEGFLEP